jgi:hypothetical protein
MLDPKLKPPESETKTKLTPAELFDGKQMQAFGYFI